jgi:hypothetical protein
MLNWTRIDPGRWAVNLDGSETANVTFPRLEVRCHGEGRWTSLCMLPAGTSHLHTCATMLEAQHKAIDDARGLLGATYRGLLDELLSDLVGEEGR